MNILFIEWNSFGKEDIIQAFSNLSHKVIRFPLTDGNYRKNPKYKHELCDKIKTDSIDLVFSSNYYPVVSDACEASNVLYLSWCYDSPLVLLYSKSIMNACNRIYVFDSKVVEDLSYYKAPYVRYMPLAVNATRLNNITKNIQTKTRDISFVGSLYNEEHNLYEKFETLDEYTKGYLDGILQAQLSVYGVNFLESSLSLDMIERIYEKIPYSLHADGFETLSYIYSNYFLCRKLAKIERTTYLGALADSMMDVHIYTKNPDADYSASPLRNAHIHGPLDYENQMPEVFASSKININLSLRSIQSGIPLRAMDIMGAGGFLLTNYQEDFLRHFVPDEDFVFFSSKEDLCAKVAYYLEHEEEREAIAANGQKKVQSNHTYEPHLATILEDIF